MNFSAFNEFFLAVILSVVQGVSEFLPISSTAHLRLITDLLTGGKDIGLATSNILQFGTLLAIIQYFWTDLKTYFQRFWQVVSKKSARESFFSNFKTWFYYPTFQQLKADSKLDKELQIKEDTLEFQTDTTIFQIILGTIPVVVLGFLLYRIAGSSRGILLICLFLVIGSILMFLAERFHKVTEKKEKTRIITKWEVLIIGFFQVLAVFPGISRSGATISGALFLGRNRAQSVRLSFLLSIPALFLAGVKDSLDLVLKSVKGEIPVSFLPTARGWEGGEISFSILAILVAFGLSYFVGFLCLKWLIKFLSSNSFTPFIVYRLLLVLLLIGFLSVGVLK